MPTYTETRILPYSPAQLFGLVADVEQYPKFLPWCRAARITEQRDDYFIGELIVSFAHITERYSSRVEPTPPTASAPGKIEVSLVSGPFTHLNNHWEFLPHPDGTEIRFAVEFQFKSKLLDKLIGGMFTRASEKMIGAFMARAQALYGETVEVTR
jgi:coenzyme Q-binding protein COQ10